MAGFRWTRAGRSFVAADGHAGRSNCNQSARLLDVDRNVLEENFIYIIENHDGRRELLKPSEFQKRVKSAATGGDASAEEPESKGSANPA